MAYRCPVCETPQQDAEHLANHLAFTAVIRSDDHEAWLDEHVPEWGEMNPETLGPKVDEAVPEVEVPELEDDGHGGHDHGGSLENELAQQAGHRGPGSARGQESPAGGRGDLAEAADGVLQEARALTEKMYGLDDETDANANEDADETTDAYADETADAEASDDASDSPEEDADGEGGESESE